MVSVTNVEESYILETGQFTQKWEITSVLGTVGTREETTFGLMKAEWFLSDIKERF